MMWICGSFKIKDKNFPHARSQSSNLACSTFHVSLITEYVFSGL